MQYSAVANRCHFQGCGTTFVFPSLINTAKFMHSLGTLFSSTRLLAINDTELKQGFCAYPDAKRYRVSPTPNLLSDHDLEPLRIMLRATTRTLRMRFL
jgi:hypothetical protein